MKFASPAATGQIMQTSSQRVGVGDVEVGDEVTDLSHYIDAGVAVPFPARPTPEHSWQWDSKTWAIKLTLNDRKASKLANFKEKFAKLVNKPITVGTDTFDAGELSRDALFKQIQVAKEAASGYTVSWTLADNTEKQLDVAGLRDVILAIDARYQQTRSMYKSLAQSIAAAQTQAELRAIDWI